MILRFWLIALGKLLRTDIGSFGIKYAELSEESGGQTVGVSLADLRRIGDIGADDHGETAVESGVYNVVQTGLIELN